MLSIQAELKKDKGRKELQLELERKTALLPVLIGVCGFCVSPPLKLN